jgi:splicing factor, proline- and glutamine-rich
MNSFEYVYGRRWKELYEFEHKRRRELDAELREQRRRLDADMEVAYEDYKAELLREGLDGIF